MIAPNTEISSDCKDPPEVKRWDDNRYYVVNLVLFPAGVVVYIGVAIFVAYFQYLIFFSPFGLSRRAQEKIGIGVSSVLVLSVVFYYLYCFYQIFFVELKRKFIAWQVIRRDNEFDLHGYYFKRDSFSSSDIQSVEPYYADRRWFSKEMGTLLTRTRWSNLNYRVELKDGRVFYLPGEMERVEELKALLAGLVLNPL